MSFYAQAKELETMGRNRGYRIMKVPESPLFSSYQGPGAYLNHLLNEIQYFEHLTGNEAPSDDPEKAYLMQTGFLAPQSLDRLEAIIRKLNIFISINTKHFWRSGMTATDTRWSMTRQLQGTLKELLSVYYANSRDINIAQPLVTEPLPKNEDVRTLARSFHERYVDSVTGPVEQRHEKLTQAVDVLELLMMKIKKIKKANPKVTTDLMELEALHEALKSRSEIHDDPLRELGFNEDSGIHIKMRFDQSVAVQVRDDGGCLGYVKLWAGELKAGQAPFGLREGEEGNTVNYALSAQARSSRAMRLQYSQHSRELEDAAEVRMRRVTRHRVKRGTGVAKVVYEQAKDNPGKIFELGLDGDEGAHSVGFRMSQAGQFELFDPNIGWMTFDSLASLKQLFHPNVETYAEYYTYAVNEVCTQAELEAMSSA